LFDASIVLEEGADEIELGSVKILEIGDRRIYSPRIDDYFTSLETSFCSLGQSVRYYRHLRDDLPLKIRRQYLRALRDIVSRPTQRSRFEEAEGFETSLLRNGSARDALNRGGHCNGRKLAYFQQNGVRMFQHLFTELNGVVGFLRVDVSYNPTLAVEYSLVRPAALTPRQFAVLELHFEKLDLADRYARQASTVVAKLVRQFRTPTNLALGRNALRRRLRQTATDRETATPPNHWEAVLMRALAANSDFTDHVFD
jgi:hypothetical protein